jgi:hypothetical protein
MAAPEQDDGRSRSPTPDESGGEEGNTEMSESKLDEKKPVNGSAKDPNRPRRKKARRACFACQRAHLTCGMCLPRVDMTCHFAPKSKVPL